MDRAKFGWFVERLLSKLDIPSVRPDASSSSNQGAGIGDGSDDGAPSTCHVRLALQGVGTQDAVANKASYAISSSLILVIHYNMIIGTNLIV
jgi:hypothetical protein